MTGARHGSIPDDLLQPTITQDVPPPGTPEARRPWRLESQFYVAFFGGSAGATMIAFLNAQRLRMSEPAQWAILLAGTAILLTSTVLTVTAGAAWVASGSDPRNSAQIVRIGLRAVGLVTFWVLYRIQKPASRMYTLNYNGPEPFASMWGWGLASVIAGNLVQGALVTVLTGVLGE